MTSVEASTRLEAELSLLDAMYPGNITFDSRSRDVHYTPAHLPRGNLTLRLPEQYPEKGSPQVISACDRSKNDIRDRIRREVDALGVEETGVEVLDQLINIFEDVISETLSDSTAHPGEEPKGKEQHNTVRDQTRAGSPPKSRTVIIWLHHLLATSKRKLAVNPTLTIAATTVTATSSSSSSPASTNRGAISGITKPGYPGIMVFSGARDLVDAHVRELKALNWQAFQIRYDSDEALRQLKSGQERDDEWEFSHVTGKIIEVESMAEVVKAIAKEEHRQLFLKAVGVK